MDGDGLVFGGVEDEAGGCVFCDVVFGGHLFNHFWGGFFAEEISAGALVGVGVGHGDDGVAEDGEVGAGAGALDGGG